jgi:colanic acid/amylovoran biosynthesis protein
VLWKGRNFRASNAVREPYELWALLYNPVVAFMFGKPVMCIGGSMWPLRNPVARFMLRAVAGRTFFFSVREHSSYERAVALLHGKRTQIELLPDLSLASLPPGGPTNRSTHESSAGPRRLGVTVVDWPGSGEAARNRYREALLGFLRRFLEREGTEVVLVHQVTYRMEDTSSLEETLLRGLASERVSAVEGSPNVDELISIYSTMDLLVATRMHSAIFALSQGTPVVTIPYDAGGKWGILDMMGARDVEVPFVSVTAESLERKVDEVWARRSELLATVRENLPALAAAVEDNVRIPVETYAKVMAAAGRPVAGHE